MKELLETILAQLRTGKRAILATIVERRGSAPRGVGTAMVISENGEQTGTVGGGSMEYRVRTDAVALLDRGESAIRSYEIHTDEKSVYSGGVTILFRSFSGEAGALLVQGALETLLREENRYLVCYLAKQGKLETSLMNATSVCALAGLDCPPEQPLVCGAEPSCLIEPLMDTPRVILFGGGHVAQMMARQLDLLSCRVWVVEDRIEYATRELFPTAERVLCLDYPTAEETLSITKRDQVIVMSRGHETDFQILRWVLRSEADYIGCIGSKRKIALTRERLLADGLTPAQIDGLHAPIGLTIGAETPAEIAVSVAAELIQHRAQTKQQ